MTAEESRTRDALRGVLTRWFNVSVSRKAAYRALKQFLGPHAAHRCLLVVAEDVLASVRVMDADGDWACVSVLEEPGPVAVSLLGDRLQSVHEGRFPFSDGEFDDVVLDHALEHFEDDQVFIAECHRILKESGRLIVMTRAQRGFSLIGPLGRMAGQGNARRGYTEARLFDTLKDGFNAEEVSTWSRFFVELTEILIHLVVILAGAGRTPGSGQVGDADRTLVIYRKVVRIHTWFYSLAVLSSWVDSVLVFLRGHALGVVARRRTWKPRVTPTLVDGRSIADATINTKIGSAGPF
jgi:SAM-dependent methyltransferase